MLQGVSVDSDSIGTENPSPGQASSQLDRAVVGALASPDEPIVKG
jgi:hypothetical protein